MKILAVDISLIFSINWEAAEGKELGTAHRRTVDAVSSARVGFERCFLAVDTGPSFRKQIPEYKANRTDRGEAYRAQLQRTIERLQADGCAVIVAPVVGTFPATGQPSYAEADDVIGWAAWQFTEHVAGLGEDARAEWRLTIFSDDSDLEQLVDDKAGVDVLKTSLRGGERWDAARVTEKRGVPPEKIADLKALCGDKSDNYKGYTGPQKERDPKNPDVEPGMNPGIGEAIAAQLVTKYGGALAIFDLPATSPEDLAAQWEAAGTKPGVRATLARHGRSVAERGLFLATISHELPGLDFAAVLAEPAVKPIAKEAEYTMPPDDEPARVVVTPIASAQLAMATRPEPAPLAARGIDVFALQPKGLQALESLSKTLYDSRLYTQYGNWQAIMAVAIEANERGIPVASAVRQAHVISGKVGWPAAFLAGLILSSGKAELFELISTDANQSTLAYKRVGRPLGRFTVTVDDARADGQLDKWIREKKSVRVMLQWKCYREAARAFFPDVCSGMHSIDEQGGATDDEGEAA